METTKETISIIPDKSLYPKLGQTGYSIGEAIAEFVDNSIDARPSNRMVKIDIKIDPKKGFIIIEDNGIGMDKETAAKSIVLGLSEKRGKLGQFGLGLKTAAMSLGKKFTIQTTQKGSDEEYILIFDEEEFIKNRDWSDFDIYIKKGTEIDRSGTKIVIEKLRIAFPANFTTYLRKQLAERFSPFILNKETQIRLNNKPLEPERISLILNTRRRFIINLSSGEKIRGWAGILEVGSQERSGFNLYRKGRLIRVHEKLGYQYHPSKMWIAGEVYLDCIPITHNKREFITTDPLYIEFLEKFIEVIKPVLADAQQRHRAKKIQDLPPEAKETLKDNLLRAVGRVLDYRELAFPTTEVPVKHTDKNGKLYEIEKREPKKGVVEIQEKKVAIRSKKRTPRKTQHKKARFITIAGKKYKFDYEWQELEDEVPKISYVDKDRGLIMVILNSRFPILNTIKDQSFYVALYVTEGIAETFLRENARPLDRVIELRDKTIGELARIITEDTEQNIAKREARITEARLKLLKQELQQGRINGLSDREIDVLRLRLGIEGRTYTLQEVGERLGLTRERVRQIEGKAISKIVGS